MNKRILSIALLLLSAMLWMSAQEQRVDSLAYARERMKAGVAVFNDADKGYLKGRQCFLEALPYADSALTVTLCRYIGLSWYHQTADDMEVSDFDKAEKDLETSLEWYNKAGERSWAVASLTELSFLKDYKGDIDRALASLDEAEKKLDIGMDEELADILKNRFRLFSKYGIVDKIPALSIKVDSLMSATSDKGVRLMCLELQIDNAVKAGHTSEAISLCHDAIGLLETSSDTQGRDTKMYAILNRLRPLCLATQKYSEAMDISRKMLAIREKDSGSDVGMEYFHVAEVYQALRDTTKALSYVDSIMNNGGKPSVDPMMEGRHLQLVGMLHGRFGKWDEAVRYYEKADSAMASVGSDRERLWLGSLKASALYNAKMLDESEAEYSRYYQGCRKVYGDDADVTITALNYLANIRAYSGRLEEGSRNLLEVKERMTRKIAERLRFLPSETRESYLDNFLDVTFRMTAYGFKARHTSDEFTENAWEALLLSKGLLLASERSAYDIIKSKGSSEDMALYGKVMNTQRTLAAMESRFGSDSDAAKEASRQLLLTDAKLAHQCAAYGNVGTFLDIDANAVRSALGNHDIIVDMADFKSDDGSHAYYAYIVRKEAPHPELVRLCVESPQDSLRYGFEALANGVIKTFLASLSSKLQHGGNVFLVPSGAFHMIPVEAGALTDGQLFGEAYNIVRLSSARDIVGINDKDINHKKRLSAYLFGNLEYGNEYAPLAATATELGNIAKALKRKAIVHENSGPEGTVEAFLSLGGESPDLIHIATHGFYCEPTGSESKSDAYRLSMNMSGLIMAGGEKLTAADIAAMDLSGTTIVSLSACETGLGHATPEGIYGLQRAFRKAGVRYLLVNVGEASDVASSLFMAEFYKAVVRNGCDIHDAFRKARQTVRQRYPDPYYWSGFLLLD